VYDNTCGSMICTVQLDGAEQALFEGVAVRDAAFRQECNASDLTVVAILCGVS
jgi:hypothetical protein